MWNGLDQAYHTNDTLLGEVSLPGKNGHLYTVTRDEPISSYRSSGVEVALNSGQAAKLEVVTDEAELFSA